MLIRRSQWICQAAKPNGSAEIIDTIVANTFDMAYREFAEYVKEKNPELAVISITRNGTVAITVASHQMHNSKNIDYVLLDGLS